MHQKPLAEQIIVITGASSGIGLATARKAAAAGAGVFLISRNGEALGEIVAAIRATGGTAAFAVADVGDKAAVAVAAEQALAEYGRIDCWVSCAGVTIYAPLLETPLPEHERLFRTNYFGVVNSAQVALPLLRRQAGTFIVVGSIAGDMPSPIMGAYAASKHAIHAFVGSLRIELIADRSPVRIALIKPSGMATPIGVHAANHQRGEARIPPLVYDPALSADAILHAATHEVRDLTIGGFGRLQVLFANHFPTVFERLAPLMIPLLSDRSKPPTPTDNLERPGSDGDERSPNEQGRTISLSLPLQKHPRLAGALLAAAGTATMLVLSRQRRHAAVALLRRRGLVPS